MWGRDDDDGKTKKKMWMFVDDWNDGKWKNTRTVRSTYSLYMLVTRQ